MKMRTIYASLFSLLLVPPVLAQDVQRVSASGPLPPEVVAAGQQSDLLVNQGEALLKTGNHRAAEQTFREAIIVAVSGAPGFNPSAERGLAETLTAEGKTAEATHLYRTLIYQYPRSYSSDAQEVRTLMGFSCLLSQTGQWPEAVAVYEKALPSAFVHGLPKLDAHFDPRVPQPVQLQAMAHVAYGIELLGRNDSRSAFKEFERGSHLAPNAALANYYYGFGWENLLPTEQARMNNTAQVKAALQKAVDAGDGEVRKAAAEALTGFK